MAERPGPQRTEEGDVLAALSAGDRRAAEQLVDQTYQQVFAALVRFTGGDKELAADLTQEVYLGILRRRNAQVSMAWPR